MSDPLYDFSAFLFKAAFLAWIFARCVQWWRNKRAIRERMNSH